MSQINEDEQMALNEQVGEEANLDTTPVAEEQAVGEVEQPEVESTEETEVEATETTGEPKKGSEARIRELNAKAKAAELKAQSLEKRLAELTGSVNPTPDLNRIGYQQTQQQLQEPLLRPGEEIDANELEVRLRAREQAILQQADARAELRQKQAEAINRINSEASEVIRLFPELDPESENFNQDLSESISEATEAYIRNNPYSASVKQFVAKLMKPYQGAVNKEVGKATENIAKQVSQAALRPTSVRKQEKSAAEKSVAELEAELGTVYS